MIIIQNAQPMHLSKDLNADLKHRLYTENKIREI